MTAQYLNGLYIVNGQIFTTFLEAKAFIEGAATKEKEPSPCLFTK